MTRIFAALFAALCLAQALGCTGPIYDTKDQFISDPPAVYVGKVKNILVGLPATDAEVAAVTADPNALDGLIDGWMALPQYQQKMMVFFELAFQQTQITTVNFVDIIPTGGLGNGKSLPLLVENARESFARTVLAANLAGQPLTNAFTTKQLMMTPALMQLYAFLDGRRADDLGNVADAFAKANPKVTLYLENAQGPLTIDQSLDASNPNTYMHFYNPDIVKQVYPDPACNKVDPISIPINSFQLFRMMYGEIPSHYVPGADPRVIQDALFDYKAPRQVGIFCPIRAASGAGIQLAPTDFTTWKLVTIRPPNGNETPTQFFDLNALRSSNELVINTPHPGFFSTPAFFANWPTNTSNQMRVTLNQALIVATGTAVDGNDPTTPGMTPGLDMDHAAPGSACYSCHQLLDPTRSILSSTYSWFYNPQVDTALKAQHGMFAFQNVIKSMDTIDDFANILASHPLVPQAWAQKLCYYVNSAPCDPADPVFQQIVADFANGFSWNSLVRELLSSPIVTNVSETTTHAKNGEVIAVSRRDHLCAALNNRLGFVDVCQLEAIHQSSKPSAIAQIMSGMPSDGYGRGATIPVLPNDSTLFYRGGLENICATVSAMVIDAKVDPMQPGAKHWSSAHPDVAISEFVSLVMGLTPSDPRAGQVTEALTNHFTAAQAAGSNATDALRSVFVASCLSPTFIGIGM